jgi:predicted patatin/cPLA2 family phospholipase
MNYFCLIGQGGGMTSAYHVGVVAALKEKYGFQKLNRIVATSGAAATYSYLVSGQEELMRPIWEDLIKSGKFVTPWKWPIAKGTLNLNALKNSQIKLEVGVTDAETGESLFFSKNDPIDYHELLRATCAVPYFSRASVNLQGRHYYDGTISSVSGLERVFDEDNILVVLIRNQPRQYSTLIRKISSWLFIRKETTDLQKAIWNMVVRYKQIPDILSELNKKKNIVVIQPKEMKLSRLRRAIKQGYDDTMNHPGLDNFFAKIS